ncbi:MAG: hypothetical protein KGI27_11845 [Thaumarchaeota archaeon]|nr:hypothetical protein [Nitrososphaerota archaeon]
MNRSCADNNPKVVTRIYNWDGKLVEINLCKDHLNDTDFQDFIKEFPLNQIIKKDAEGSRFQTSPSGDSIATEAT